MIQTKILLVPLVLLQSEQEFLLGTVATVASVLGAVFAYYVGQRGGRPLLERFISTTYVDRIE
ncbi:YqaA family protein [Halopiger aswanensis]|uniref:hypothetical protein n=1 Tax=Halopiger aswanensis TaxID=148449 RepID=UPI0011C3CB59|nr:hypothetical protein [Halopiger aswanensis]